MSRMEKYSSSSVKSRTNRNEKLYNEVNDLSINYDYIDVNNAVELNPDKDYKSSRENFHKQRELDKILRRQTQKVKETIDIAVPTEERVYDINQILENSKVEDEKELYNEQKSKRLINTEYNILTKLDIKNLDKENYRKEDLKALINDIYAKEEPKKMTAVNRKENDELFKDLLDDNNDGDLIDDLNLKEELAKDILEKNQDDLGTVPITEEIKDTLINKEIPESYHEHEDDHEMFIFDEIKAKKKKKNKNREISEISQSIKEQAMSEDGIDYDNIDKDGKGLLIAIIVVVILIILTILFFLYEYFFGA